MNRVAKERYPRIDKTRWGIDADGAVLDRVNLFGVVIRNKDHIMASASSRDILDDVDAIPRAGVAGIVNQHGRPAVYTRIRQHARALSRARQDGQLFADADWRVVQAVIHLQP